LPKEYRRFENPHIFKVGISKNLLELKNSLVTYYQKPAPQ